MNADLLEQLHNYREHFNAEVPELEFDDVRTADHQTRELSLGRPIGRQARLRPVMVVVVAVFLTLFFVGAVGILSMLGGSDTDVIDAPRDPEITQPSVPTTLTTSPTTLPEQPTGLLTVLDAPPGWTRVEHDESVFPTGSHISTVTRAGPGLVALGHICDSRQRNCELATWASADGLSWDHHLIGGEGAEIEDAIAAGPGVVAVGISKVVVDANAVPPQEGCVQGVWVSEDGISWEPVSTMETPHEAFKAGISGVSEGCNLRIMGITEMDGRLYAVGSAMGTATAVWTSDDGRAWKRLAEDDPAWSGDAWLDDIFVLGNTLVTPGGYCNTVEVGSEDMICFAAAWASNDAGASWTRVDHAGFYGPATDPEVSGWIAQTVVRDGTLFSLASVCGQEGGLATDCVAVTWTTQDGITWTRHDLDPSLGFLTSTLGLPRHLTATHASLYALDEELDSGAEHMWMSADGIDWQEIPVDEPVLATAYDTFIGAITPVGSGLVAVGSAPSPHPNQWAGYVPAIWTWNPTN